MTKERTLPKQAILIVNGASRKGAEAFEDARAKLIAAGIELIDARAVDEPEAMSGEVRSAIDRAPMVIVGGGDGSLSETIDHFLGHETVFALLPLGTANSFARTLGIPLDLEGAIEVILSGEPKRIDLAAINGDYFLNNAALGLAPIVAESVPGALKRSLGRLGYLMWAGWSAASFKAFRLKIHDGRTTHRLWATEARIANGTHHGGVELVEDQALDSGDIVIQAVTGKSLWGLAWSWFATLFKLRHRAQTTTEWRGRKLQLEARPNQKISIDGEIAAKTPVTVEVARGAIEVAAPRD